MFKKIEDRHFSILQFGHATSWSNLLTHVQIEQLKCILMRRHVVLWLELGH